MKHLGTLLTLVVALLLAVVPLASAQEALDLSNTHWTLVSISGQPVHTGSSVTLLFGADGHVGGSAGCNTYGGEYTLTGSTLTVGELVSTLMACEESIMQQESAYLAALQSAVSVEQVNGQLVVAYGEGQQLVFAPALTLENTGWTLVSINGEPVVSGTAITLGLDGKGGVAGSAGCNSYSGSYTIDGETLTFGPLVTTRMACPEAIMQQETAYLSALEGGAAYTIANGRLTLVAANGTELVFAPALSLTSGEWTLTSLGGEAALDGAPATLTFGADGTAFGSAGCNTFNLPYTVDGESLTFGSSVLTLMACEESIMTQESALMSALAAATAYRIEGNQFVIVYGEGQELVFEAAKPVVTATVTYRERIALPANAEVTVTLEDISRADAPADVLTSQTLVSGGANVPFTFELPYDPAQIDEGALYSVRAQITVDGVLWFTSDTIAPVLTRGAGTDVELVLVRVP